MKKILLQLFARERKPLTMFSQTEEQKPELKVFSTCVPQTFVDKVKVWDTQLYTKQTIFNDV